MASLESKKNIILIARKSPTKFLKRPGIKYPNFQSPEVSNTFQEWSAPLPLNGMEQSTVTRLFW